MLTRREAAEQLDMLAGKMRPSQVRGAMRAAERLLREEEAAEPLTEEEVRLLMANTARGQEYALYLEDRGYPKVQAAILDSAYGDGVRVIYSNGMRYIMEMQDYNRTWRLWAKYPSGVEMKVNEWRARK